MKRRASLAAAGVLAMPAIGRAAATSTLRFIPQSDLTILDPVFTTGHVTRNHGYLVFDTLFGQDAKMGQAQGWVDVPQIPSASITSQPRIAPGWKACSTASPCSGTFAARTDNAYCAAVM